MRKETLTYERANELLRYDPDTGKMFWKVARSNVKAGSEAGSVSFKRGKDRPPERQVRIDGKLYQVRRLIWLLYYQKWPENLVVSIDGDSLNTKIKNLQDASLSAVCSNQLASRENTSGVAGVTWAKRRGKWEARVNINGKLHFLGYFDDVDEAAEAVIAFRKKMGVNYEPVP